jgi:T-complex protein 1 subunit zeta
VSSLVALVDAILTQCEFKLSKGAHPRMLVRGLEEARTASLRYLDDLAIAVKSTRSSQRHYVLSAARTKSQIPVADVVVDAIRLITIEDRPIDLDRIEILKIHSTADAVRLVRGLVLDQHFRHELMAKSMQGVRILALNVSLEVENSAVTTLMRVANADERERMTIAERKFVDTKLRTIVEFRSLFPGDFVLINGKGIDAPCLDMLSHANISALRRVSQKTLQRLVYACGCRVVNCVDDLSERVLGNAGKVTEEDHRGQKYVFIDDIDDPKAVSIVISGMTDQTARLTEAAVKDGLRALKHAVDDRKVLPGAGAVQLALRHRLWKECRKAVSPRLTLGVEAFADALLAIPRALIRNAGLQDALIIPQMLSEAASGELAGVDLETGDVVDPTEFGIFDSYRVVRGIVQAAPIVASQLLLVDQIIETQKQVAKRKDDG